MSFLTRPPDQATPRQRRIGMVVQLSIYSLIAPLVLVGLIAQLLGIHLS